MAIRLLHGDCLELMKGIPDKTVDIAEQRIRESRRKLRDGG